MRDVKRLFEETAPFERALLWSGRDEAPPDDLEGRILGAYTALPAAAASPTPNASPAGKPSFVRHLRAYHLALAIAAVGAFAGVTTAVVAHDDAPTQAPTAGPVTRQTQESRGAAPAPGPAGDTRTISDQAAVVITPDSLPSAPAAPRALGSSVAAPSGARALGGSPGKSASQDVEPSLERELVALATVKASLSANATSDAARTLDLYDAEFPHGSLRPEATVLRIRTLLLQGNRPAAQKLADDYLEQYPNSVHSRRIRALLAE
jgi:hypothetical protein